MERQKETTEGIHETSDLPQSASGDQAADSDQPLLPASDQALSPAAGTEHEPDDGLEVSRARPMQTGRFLLGLLLSTLGLGGMVLVVVSFARGGGPDAAYSLPLVAVCMILGLLLLGGGFGIMATAAPKFDDDEFERLMRAGDVAEPDEQDTTWTPEAALAPQRLIPSEADATHERHTNTTIQA